MAEETSFATCDTQKNAVARNVIATFCGDDLGLVRSVNGTSSVELVDITSITDTRRNNAEAFETATATVEIFGLDSNIPTPGLRGTLSLTGGAVTFEEYLICESVSVQAAVGEVVIYTVTFQSAVDMTESGGGGAGGGDGGGGD